MDATSAPRNRSDEAARSRATMRPSKALAPPSTPGPAVAERRPQIGQARLDIGRRGDDRRERPRARARRLAVEDGAGMVEPRLVGEHEPAVAAHAP